MLKFVAVLSLLASTVSMADRLAVDDAIEELRAKANHLEQLKTLFSTAKCAVEIGTNRIALTPNTLMDNGAILGVTDTIPGTYLSFSQAPKPHHLKNVIQHAHLRAVNRVYIISSSLAAEPGATEYTHLRVKVAEPELQKDVLDPVTMKPSLIYGQYPMAIALDKVRGGHTTKEITFKGGGSFRVVCQ